MSSPLLSYKWTEKYLSPKEGKILNSLFQKDILPIYIALSGWPDSMCLVQLIFDIFFTNSLDMSRIVILYADHRTTYMPSLFEYFTTYFSPFSIVGCSLLPHIKSSETEWRKQRQDFFLSHMSHTWWILCTGHNLTDRIETTLLNLQRGTQKRGLINMQFIQSKYIWWREQKNNQYIHVRPLLGWSKHTTKEICDFFSIPYWIDNSNTDWTKTVRNALRKKFSTDYLPQKVVQQRTHIFSHLEQTTHLNYKQNVIPFTLFSHPQFPSGCMTPLPQSRHELSCLLSRQKLYNWVTKAFLDDLFTFLTTAKVGYRYVRGTRICLAQKKLYFFPATTKTPFWKITKSTTLWKILPQQKRLPQTWDRYHGKLFSKRLSKKWVPFFVRPFIPVVAEWKEIISFEISKIKEILHH